MTENKPVKNNSLATASGSGFIGWLVGFMGSDWFSQLFDLLW